MKTIHKIQNAIAVIALAMVTHVNCVHAFREKFKRGASKRIGG